MVEMLSRWISDFVMKRRMEECFVILGEGTWQRRGGILEFWWR